MIYLDHAAATPVSAKALAAMEPYFCQQFFNPSAPYLPAKHVREAYAAAKDAIAHAIGAKGADLVITAGATESINLAFTAAAPAIAPLAAAAQPSVASPTPAARPHPAAAGKVLVLATEHAAVLEAAKRFPHALIAVDRTGLIDLADLRRQLADPAVTFLSVSLAGNELGTIQPLAEIAELVRQTRQQRLAAGLTTPLYLHSDASQAANLIDINVARLGVDLLTLNAAKCGGPKGVGALYLAHGVPVRPLVAGGGQERGLRSGTENVPGVMGFAAAITDAKAHLVSNRQKYTEMRRTLQAELEKLFGATPDAPAPVFLGHPRHQLANFLPLCFPGIDAERLIYRLEQSEIYLSTGAACAANKGSKSHVLAAIGLSDCEIAGSLRLTLGGTNQLSDMPVVAAALHAAVAAECARAHRTATCPGAASARTHSPSAPPADAPAAPSAPRAHRKATRHV